MATFGHVHDASRDRIDFALLSLDNDVPSGFVACREFDAETVYWQYGGMFPNVRGTPKVKRETRGMIEHCLEKYERIVYYVENTNKAMIKLGLFFDFKIIGTRTFKNDILIEMILEKGE